MQKLQKRCVFIFISEHLFVYLIFVYSFYTKGGYWRLNERSSTNSTGLGFTSIRCIYPSYYLPIFLSIFLSTALINHQLSLAYSFLTTIIDGNGISKAKKSLAREQVSLLLKKKTKSYPLHNGRNQTRKYACIFTKVSSMIRIG